MSKVLFENLNARFKLLQTLLNLGNWEIQLIEEEALDIDGLCSMIYNDYKAVIKIKSSLSLEDKTKTLIHELLHCIHRDEYDLAQECIKDEYQNELYTRLHERSIQQMAKTFYNMLENSNYEY